MLFRRFRPRRLLSVVDLVAATVAATTFEHRRFRALIVSSFVAGPKRHSLGFARLLKYDQQAADRRLALRMLARVWSALCPSVSSERAPVCCTVFVSATSATIAPRSMVPFSTSCCPTRPLPVLMLPVPRPRPSPDGHPPHVPRRP